MADDVTNVRRTLVGAGLAVAGLAAVVAGVTRRLLHAADHLARFDTPAPPLQKQPGDVSEALDEVIGQLQSSQRRLGRADDQGDRRARVRQWLDDMGRGVEHDCELVPVDGPVRGEWVVPPDADPRRRLLYVHGGAFEAGSPLSHRSLTTRIAQATGMPVLAVDYRLQPEHDRQDALDDVDAAWALLCARGPDGPAPLHTAHLMGDSAGGNLALGLAQRLRDGGARQPDAVAVFAPLTDSTFASPSWHDNLATDPFLGPGFRRLLDVPRSLLVLGLWAATRIRPDDPRVSPALGDLHDLPPTLVQVSDDEMLRDDGIRYARAARAAGSPVQLQVWPRLVHVWQAFADLPEAAEALDEALAFLAEHEPVSSPRP